MQPRPMYLRYHESAQGVRVLLTQRLEVVDIDLALVHRQVDNFKARQRRAGRVGAVRRGRDDALVALGLTTGGKGNEETNDNTKGDGNGLGEVVVADAQQACQLALRAAVGLQADGVVACVCTKK